MAIDGILLNKQVEVIADYLPCKIQKISQISDYELLFLCRNKEKGKFNLFISTHPNTAHVSILDQKLATLDEPKGFLMLLRKHLEQAVISDITQINYDRWFTLTIHTFNTLGDAIEIQLVVELMGKYANLILVNEEGIIIDAIKRIPPFQNQLRTIQPGAKFIPTPSQRNKVDPFACTFINKDISLADQFQGFSKELALQVSELMASQDFMSIMQMIRESSHLYISKINNTFIYHCIPLTYLKNTPIKMNLMEGINYIFETQEQQERLKSLTADVVKCIKNNKKHFNGKIRKLNEQLELSNDYDLYRNYGDMIFTLANQSSGHDTITAYDYEAECEVSIPLESKYDSYTNARRYYKKYNKSRKGIEHIENQLDIARKEYDYFSDLYDQLDYMDVIAATQIRTQLQQKGYLKVNKQSKPNHKKKNKEITINSIEVNGVRIYYGKNSIQNETITFNTNARKGLWFHVKDSSGAHVLLTDHYDDEFYIRLCAQIAALFSPYRHSSSVEVQYCPVNKVKKLPKGNPGQVLLSNYKSIFIDPDESIITQYHL